jgi:hypothetical protein
MIYAGRLTYCVGSAMRFWERVLNLPCSSNLTAGQADRVRAAIRRAAVA